LYIDKALREHNLLQAIARVNRIYEGKDFGYIVDYRGLINELNDAMEVYSGSGLENFDGDDIKGALVDVISIIGKLRGTYSNLIQFFNEVKDKTDKEQYEIYLEDDKIRKDFYNLLSEYSKYVSIAIESEHVYNTLKREELNKYKNDLRFFQELRRAVKYRYSDMIDHKEYEAKMQRLIDNYIAAEDIIRITNPVEITDSDGFEKELQRLETPRGKADAIRTRLTKHIHKKWDENPAYYKKFSVRIQEILDNYKHKRITDAEYLEQISKLKTNYIKGDSFDTYPKTIKNNIHAQAFYGVTKDGMGEVLDLTGKDEIIAEFALKVTRIIEKNSKVDWHNNPDVHKKMKQEMDILLYEYKQKYFYNLDISDFDKIIEENMKVAINRF
jgi:type I restriction enzyme R subunit